MLSQHIETDYALQLLEEAARTAGGPDRRRGGSGYLLKDRVACLHDFAATVRRVAGGDSVVDPALVDRLIARRRTRDPLEDLTERERSVLTLMAQGRSNAAICRHLRLSSKTVEAHVRNIFNRLDLAPTGDDNRRVLAVLVFLRNSTGAKGLTGVVR